MPETAPTPPPQPSTLPEVSEVDTLIDNLYKLAADQSATQSSQPTQSLEPVPTEETQSESTQKSPLEKKIDDIREKVKKARDDGKSADLKKIKVTSDAIEDRAKKIVTGAGSRAETVSHVFRTAVHMHADRVVREGWARTEDLANRSFDALKNVGRIAWQGTKITAVLAALPVSGVGAAVEMIPHGFKELGVDTAKKFSDAKIAVREFSVRGKAAKEAAVLAFRMVAPTKKQTREQKLLRAEMVQSRFFRDEMYKRNKADLVARRPITLFVAEIKKIVK